MKIYLILFLFAFLLTLETQAKNHNKTITKKEFLDSQMKILEARFNAVDTNKDGKITPEEKKKFAEKINKLIIYYVSDGFRFVRIPGFVRPAVGSMN